MKTRKKKRQETIEVKMSRRSRGELRGGEMVSEKGSGAREAAVLLSRVIVHAWAVRQRRAA